MRAIQQTILLFCALGAASSWADCRVATIREDLKLSHSALERRGGIFMALCTESVVPLVDGDDATLLERVVRPAITKRSLSMLNKYYPIKARRNSVQGKVVHVLVVEADGRVSQDALIESSGSKALDSAAAAYLRDIEFSGPGQLDGAPTRMFITIPLTFSTRSNDGT